MRLNLNTSSMLMLMRLSRNKDWNGDSNFRLVIREFEPKFEISNEKGRGAHRANKAYTHCTAIFYTL